MNAQATALEAATIRQQCRVLHLPTVATRSIASLPLTFTRRQPPRA